MENGSGGVHGLHVVLHLQGVEDIVCEADRQMRAVGVVGGAAVLLCGDDLGELLRIVLGKAEGRGLRRGGLQVIEVAVFLLIVGEAVTHMLQNLHSEDVALLAGDISGHPRSVLDGFVHAHDADGGEVIGKGSQVTACVGIQALIHQAGDDLALHAQGSGRDIHVAVEHGVELIRVLGYISHAGKVEGDYADGTGALTGSEVTAAFFSQLAQVEAETAAHGADIGRLHVRVYIIGKIRGAVFGGHLKEEAVVLGLAPVKVPGDGIGRDRILETASVGVAPDHDLDEGLVDHVHFLLAVAVGEILGLAADDGRHILHISRDCPVQSHVGKGSLCAPSGGGVDAVDKGLDTLHYFAVGQVVDLDEGCQICVKGGEGLGACPLVLHDAQEIDHLVAEGGEVLGGSGCDPAGNTAESFLNELLQTPARTVAGQHGQVMQVDETFAVGIGDLIVIDLSQPVVGSDRAGVGEDQAADTESDSGILLDAPVFFGTNIAVHQLLVVQQGLLGVTYLLVLAAVEDIALGGLGIAGLHQRTLDAVLDLFDLRHLVHFFASAHQQKPDCPGDCGDISRVHFARCDKCLCDRVFNLCDVKIHDPAVALPDLCDAHLVFSAPLL